MTQHIGIAACAAEGASLCYRTICAEGAMLLGPDAVDSIAFDGAGPQAGCDAAILGCTEIPLIIDDANSPLPTLDSARLLARAALHQAVGVQSGSPRPPARAALD